MKTTCKILKGLLLMGIALCSSCFDQGYDCPVQDTVPLTFYLQTAGEQTRAYEGTQAATDAENEIKTIKVWLFDGNDFVGYSDQMTNNKVVITIPRSLVVKGKVDVYAIANAESVGLGALDENSTLSDLTSAIIGGDNFLPQANVANLTRTVPTSGLPYSQVAKECPITANGISATLPTIMLTRAVSKVRFAFARSTGMTDVEITGIKINGGLIASDEYIFPDAEATGNFTSPYNGDKVAHIKKDGTDDYIAQAIVWGSTETGDKDGTTAIIPTNSINEVDNPDQQTYIKKYGKTSGHGADYNAFVDETFIKYGDANNPQYRNDYLTYLRESDQRLTGTIYYRTGKDGTETGTEHDGDIKSYNFSMDVPQDFARNHIWIVYGYFMGGNKLYLEVTVLPWEDVKFTVDYKNEPSWTKEIEWTGTSINSTTTETIDGTQYNIVYVKTDGTSAECKFNFNTPQGWNWVAELITIQGDEGYFKFDNNLTSTFGRVGTEATLTIKVPTTAPSELTRARIKFYVRTETGDMVKAVTAQPIEQIISRGI